MADEWLPQINPEFCTGCRQCITYCPTSALKQIAGKARLAHPYACIYCATCEEICPVYAIELPYLICFAEEER